MAAGRFEFPTPPSQGDPNHAHCPVCGWSPCTSTCRLGLSAGDLMAMRLLFQAGEAQDLSLEEMDFLGVPDLDGEFHHPGCECGEE